MEPALARGLLARRALPTCTCICCCETRRSPAAWAGEAKLLYLRALFSSSSSHRPLHPPHTATRPPAPLPTRPRILTVRAAGGEKSGRGECEKYRRGKREKRRKTRRGGVLPTRRTPLLMGPLSLSFLSSSLGFRPLPEDGHLFQPARRAVGQAHAQPDGRPVRGGGAGGRGRGGGGRWQPAPGRRRPRHRRHGRPGAPGGGPPARPGGGRARGRPGCRQGGPDAGGAAQSAGRVPGHRLCRPCPARHAPTNARGPRAGGRLLRGRGGAPQRGRHAGPVQVSARCVCVCV
jgi:hypothetical protein